MRATILGWASLLLVGAPVPAMAQGQIGTLTLDTLSFISFQDQVTNVLPAGGTLQFHFGDPAADGSIPFHMDPTDVNLPAVRLEALDATVQYALGSTSTGTLISTPTGKRISFNAVVTATDVDAASTGMRAYTLEFTTEEASAQGSDGGIVAVDGERVPSNARYVRLVGATVNKSENVNGLAVYMVLSGLFDDLP